jgi:hypothetical protein
LCALKLAGWWEDLGTPLSVVPRLPVDTTVFLFFLLESRDVLSSRSAGEGCIVERAFIEANSSCMGMMVMEETCKQERKVPVTPPFVVSNSFY